MKNKTETETKTKTIKYPKNQLWIYKVIDSEGLKGTNTFCSIADFRNNKIIDICCIKTTEIDNDNYSFNTKSYSLKLHYNDNIQNGDWSIDKETLQKFDYEYTTKEQFMEDFCELFI